MYSAPYRAASDQTTYCSTSTNFPWDGKIRPRFGLILKASEYPVLGLIYKLNSSRSFFPTHRTNGLKRKISNFSAKENEKFYECWERYMEAINACPHHGFDTWLLVSYFYDGMFSSMKQLLETMCGGDFMSKNPKEAIDFLSYVAEVSRDGMNRTKGKVGKMKSQTECFQC
ncbi:hypothetical protein CK203_060491 [Vitis vinifera]|uniref:Retrotransposon gag domain-containing protein n=1 Tax=Vitis vinifera TaxID=29760 RepID=A0A438GJT6_VITVI|nr:hypothetical protein CK203_060491 [Vitis vinifera]